MLKVLSLFSGIGAFEKALDNLEVDYELVNYCEIDKYASKSYSAIHGVSEDMNLWDVTKVDTSKLPEDIDFLTYGFPCQDISLAGKQKGFHHEDGSLTRSGLFFEALRIIEDTKPKIAIAENVKNLTSKKFAEQFKIVLESLEEAGYNNYWKVLNAKDYGVPQNRERVFIVAIRKDIDHGLFEFPAPFPLEKRLKDVLEDEVDEKYYLSEDKISSIAKWKAQQKPFERVNGKNSISPTLTARGAGLEHSGMITYCDELEETTNLQVGIDKSSNNPQVIDVANCITAREDRGVSRRRSEGTAVIEIKEATKKGFAEAFEGDSINLEHPNSKTRRGRVGKGVAQTLTTSCNQAVVTDEPKILQLGHGYNPGGIKDGKICPSITTSSWEHNNLLIEPKIDVVGNHSPSGHDASRIVSPEGLAPTVKENHGTVTAIVEPAVKHKRVAKTSGKRR